MKIKVISPKVVNIKVISEHYCRVNATSVTHSLYKYFFLPQNRCIFISFDLGLRT